VIQTAITKMFNIKYDSVYAAGIEEGGHPLDDDVTTMVLTPRIVESLSIPVVTTGGIAPMARQWPPRLYSELRNGSIA